MKKVFLTILLLANLVFMSCNENRNKVKANKHDNQKDSALSASAEIAVPFTEAKNYFVRNDFKNGRLQILKLVAKAEFDSVIGAATTMSINERPAAIDFAKQFVIAVIAPETDSPTEIVPKKLQQSGNDIWLSYAYKIGDKQSFTIRPLLLLLVDGHYKGDVKLVN